MSEDPLVKTLLITPLHRAVYRILLEAGFKEGRSGEDGVVEGSPVGMASLLTDTLMAYPSEDQLLDAMTWGQGRETWDEIRPVARKLLRLIEPGSSPA